MKLQKHLPPFSSQVSASLYCHLEMKVRSSAAVVVSCAGRERVLPSYRIARRDYVCYGLEFVAEGQGTLKLRNREQEIGPGSLFLYGPGLSHEITTDSRKPFLKYFVDFFGNESAAWFRESGLKPGGVVRVTELESTRSLFESLIREGRKSSSTRAQICRDYLHLILLKSKISISQGEKSSTRALETFEKCRHLIETRYATLRNLQDLSESLGMDGSHLCRLYRRFREDSPYASLVRRKMDAAAEILASRPVLVKEVASLVGYEDALHFTRVFTRYFGLSPTAFLKSKSGLVVSE